MKLKLKMLPVVLVLCLGGLCLGIVRLADATSSQSQPQGQPNTQPNAKTPKKRTTKKPQKPPLPPLPSGPTGPVQQVPLDSIAPVPPKVSYQNAQLTIDAPNSTLGDILRAVRKQTGAEIEIPAAATERVVTHLGPGPARDVIADLLNGSRFNYVLLGATADSAVLTRVVLVPKSGPDNATPNTASVANEPQPHTGGPGAAADPNDADAAEDDSADQAAAEAEQPQPPPDPSVKTPQQMLQEMQQRQLQLQQQQQQSGQPPPGAPQRPQQEQ